MWGRLQPARDFSPAGETRMNAAAGGLKPPQAEASDNIWLQPLDDSRMRRITNFPSEGTRVFYWSSDGRTLGVLRTLTDPSSQ